MINHNLAPFAAKNETPPERPAGPPEKKNRPERMGLYLLWWLLAGGFLAILLAILISNRDQSSQISLTEFERKFDKKEILASQIVRFHVERTQIKVKLLDAAVEGEPRKNNPAEGPQTHELLIATYAFPDKIVADLIDKVRDKGVNVSSETGSGEWFMALAIYGAPFIILLVVFLMLRRMGGAGTAMSFGRSRGKMYAQEELGITFDQVAGIDEAVDELREIVEFLRSPGKYQALGGRIPRGVLLVGPPGTGKTLLAKAVAGEAGVPFFSLSGSDFVEMFVGVGAARVRDMFAQAVARSPAIIFIDELDALGKTRGSGMPGGHDEREQTLNALLVEMDGFSSDQSVIVMAATNRPETLDPALMRPGRFDRHVLVDRPDVRGREAILKVHIGKVKVGEEVDLANIARLTPGFVGADLANLVNEAALLAARKNKTKVTKAEFEEAIERLEAGLEKQSKIIPPDEKKRVAYHECGHALVACTLPNTDPVHKISIIPRGLAALGYMLQRPSEDRHLHMQSELESRICVLLGGISAEQIIFQETSTGAQNDLERATDIARRMVMEFGMSPSLGRISYRDSQRPIMTMGRYFDAPTYANSEETLREIDLEVKRIVTTCSKTAMDILTKRRNVLEALAGLLIEKEVMDAEQLQGILDQFAMPQIKPGTEAKIPHPLEPTPPVVDWVPQVRPAEDGA